MIFEQIETIIKELDFINKSIELKAKDIILNLINQGKNEFQSEILNIDKQVKILKSKQEKLLDMKLDELIDEKTYLLKYNLLENEIKDCFEQKLELEKSNF